MKISTWLGQISIFGFVFLTSACGRFGFEQHERSDAAVPFDAGNVDDAGHDASADLSIDAPPDLGSVTVPRVVVSPTSGLATSETGTSATFTVRLATQPTQNVFVLLSSSDSTEATVAPTALAFSMLNWNSPQLVTVTGVDDAEQDGNQDFTIVTGNATSADPEYSDLEVDDVAGSNRDDETPGIVVTPTSGLVTSEEGGTATFLVSLQSEPTADVSVALSSGRPDEGEVTPASVTFTTSNWASAQVVTVTGVDDSIADGPQAYVVHVGPSTSTQASYSGLTGSNVSVTNEDDEMARLVVAPLTGLTTTEAGGTATFTVALGTEPAASVTVSVASTLASEGSPSPATLSFTTTDWMTAQTVTVAGADDSIVDGDQPYEVIVHVTGSADAMYASAADNRVSLTNIDNETPGITVSPMGGLATSESGTTASFTVVLNAPPTADVVVTLSSDNTLEGTVAPASLTFTPADWMLPQTVTVTGVDDSVADGSRAYTIVTAPASSADSNYAGINAADVSLTNLDNDTAGVTVSPTSGLMTSESGTTATFSVVLNVAPVANVAISFSSGNPSEGTVSPLSVTFTPGNWSAPQIVTVTGVDDFFADGSVLYSVIASATVSASAAYNGLPVSDVSVTNVDDDVAGISVSPTSGLTTSEGGAFAAVFVVLTSQPRASVSIDFVSDNAAEGYAAPSSFTFSTSDWNVPHQLTLWGVDDSVDDGDIAYTIVSSAATSTDVAYSGMSVSDVTVTNIDNDMASVIVTPTSGVTATEGGASGSFTIALASQPTADVTVALTSSDYAQAGHAPASVTFTSSNWNAPQTVTVSAADDSNDDGDMVVSIITSSAVSADSNYNGLNVSDVSVTIVDNDAVGVAVTPSAGLVTTEIGGTATFTLTLTSQPTANVSIALSSSNLSEGTVSAASVTFTTGNWNVPQSITVTGVNDLIYDGYVSYSVLTGATSSTDPAYNGLAVSDVSVTNQNVITYIKASNTGTNDQFGNPLVLSADGNTLAIAAVYEDSAATGVDADQTDNSLGDAGAVYVFTRTGWTWTQQAYIKPSTTHLNERFGQGLSLSADGATLAIGAPQERSNATGIGGNQTNLAAGSSGAVFVFTRSGSVWTQEAYIKASNTGTGDNFGVSSALSVDGNTLVVGAYCEGSSATGIGGNQADNSATYAGAVYAFTRSGTVWSQQAYIKASNTNANDYFGNNIALSSDGNTLAVGAVGEQSNATGVGGNQANNATLLAGATYVFTRAGAVWSQQAYIKASDTHAVDFFGGVHLSGDGDTLVVSSNSSTHVYTRVAAVWSFQQRLPVGQLYSVSISLDSNTIAIGNPSDDSNATNIGGNAADTSATDAGAVLVYTRSAGVWTQEAYIKAPNSEANDYFGSSTALSSDGNTLVVGASQERSNATGINGNQANNSAGNSGAAYVYE